MELIIIIRSLGLAPTLVTVYGMDTKKKLILEQEKCIIPTCPGISSPTKCIHSFLYY
jgi:hypothetical protein